jgi:hypothetical protein
MPKPNKTLKVETIKQLANDVLRDSPNGSVEQRETIHVFVSNLLMQAKAYKGFNYLSEDQVAPGRSFGIVFDASPAHQHKYPDPTRTFFY